MTALSCHSGRILVRIPGQNFLLLNFLVNLWTAQRLTRNLASDLPGTEQKPQAALLKTGRIPSGRLPTSRYPPVCSPVTLLPFAVTPFAIASVE